MLTVQALRDGVWRAVSTPQTDGEATADVAAEQRRSGRHTAVRVLGHDGAPLRVWGPAVTVPTAVGPTAWLL